MTERAAAPGPRARTDWGLVWLALALGALAAYHQFKLPPVLPLLLERYGYDRAVAGGFMGIYAVAGLALSTVIGLSIERQGLRRSLIVSFGFLLAGSVLTLVAPAEAIVVLVARGLEGIGFAIIAIVAPVLATSSATRRHVPMAIAIFAAWIPTGQLIASALAAPIVAQGVWQPLWWIGIGLTLAFAVLLWRRTGQVATLQPGRRTPLALVPAQWAGLVLNAVIFMLWSTELFAFYTWMPQFLVEQRGLTLAESQWPYSLSVAGIMVFSILGGFMLRRGLSFTAMMAIGLAIQAVVWFIVPALESPTLGLLLVALYGAASGITPTGLFAGPSVMLGPEKARGTAYAVLMTGRNSGVLLGPVILPFVHDWLGAWGRIGLVFGAIAALAAVLAVALGFLARRLPKPDIA